MNPEPHWQAMLGEWGRATDRMGHVEIWWDEQVARWVLVEHVPAHAIPPHLLVALTEDPLASPFRVRQHQVYRETGKLPLAFWVIQGDKGGHKLVYNEVESQLAQWYGGSREPPQPGSLPYAPFDTRVLEALRGYDWLMANYRSYLEAAEQRSDEALRRMRADLVAQAEAQISDAVEAALPALMDADLPQVDGPPPDYEQETARYIETGESEATGGRLSTAGTVTI